MAIPLASSTVYLKEKLESISESERSRNIETQRLKIHDLEKTRIGISWLFRESKIGGVTSVFLPLLPAMLALWFAQAFVAGILQRHADIKEQTENAGIEISLAQNSFISLHLSFVYCKQKFQYIEGDIKNSCKRIFTDFKLL